METGTAFAAGDVHLALALGHTQIGAAIGAHKELVVLALHMLFLSEADGTAHSTQPLQIVEIFQISLFNVAAQGAEDGPCDHQHGHGAE